MLLKNFIGDDFLEQIEHILIVPSFYPQEENRQRGQFFREQALALFDSGKKIGVIYSETRSIKDITFSGIKKNHFQLTYYSDNGLKTITRHSWNIIPHKFLIGVFLWIIDMIILGIRYNKRFGKPNIIHAHNVCYAGLVARILSKIFSVPYVITEHSSEHATSKIGVIKFKIIKKTYLHCNKVITVSNQLVNLISQKYGITKHNMTVINNMVDTEFFYLKDKTNGLGDKFVFLTVCNLGPIKNVDILIKAFKLAFSGNEKFLLRIVGTGDMEKKLKALVVELALEKQVQFLGRLNKDGVREEMCNSDVFVIASKYETFGIVLIEALATGTPVIGTKVGGQIEIVNEENGILVEANNIEMMAKKMKYIMQNVGKYDSNILRKYVVKRYSKTHIIDMLNNLYKCI